MSTKCLKYLNIYRKILGSFHWVSFNRLSGGCRTFAVVIASLDAEILFTINAIFTR